jgi:hypothetical protein
LVWKVTSRLRERGTYGVPTTVALLRPRASRTSQGPFGRREPTAPTYEWVGRPAPSPTTADTSTREDIVDAVIVEDEFHPGPSGPAAGAKGLPRAPEPHTQRPGTTRPGPSENNVSSRNGAASPVKPGLAAQHRSEWTYDRYLQEMASIALDAQQDKDLAEKLADGLAKVADALRAMASDLLHDKNIDTRVTDLIADLADSAGQMKIEAQRCADACGLAADAAVMAASEVARVYHEDLDAMAEVGLPYASAASHHN